MRPSEEFSAADRQLHDQFASERQAKKSAATDYKPLMTRMDPEAVIEAPKTKSPLRRILAWVRKNGFGCTARRDKRLFLCHALIFNGSSFILINAE